MPPRLSYSPAEAARLAVVQVLRTAGAFIVLVSLLFVVACSSPGPVPVVKIERCPVEPPDIICPTVSADTSLEQLEDAYVDCREVALNWRAAWDACKP